MIDFEIKDRLHMLKSSYSSLQGMAGVAEMDSENVADVMAILNLEFDRIIEEIEKNSKRRGGLSVV